MRAGGQVNKGCVMPRVQCIPPPPTVIVVKPNYCKPFSALSTLKSSSNKRSPTFCKDHFSGFILKVKTWHAIYSVCTGKEKAPLSQLLPRTSLIAMVTASQSHSCYKLRFLIQAATRALLGRLQSAILFTGFSPSQCHLSYSLLPLYSYLLIFHPLGIPQKYLAHW